MAIPDYQTVMLPLLGLVNERGEQSIRELTAALADHFALTDAERAEILASGKQHRFENPVNWAASDVVRAGMLERPARGRVRITKHGHDVLASGRNSITRD
jgi:restriction system protein